MCCLRVIKFVPFVIHRQSVHDGLLSFPASSCGRVSLCLPIISLKFYSLCFVGSG